MKALLVIAALAGAMACGAPAWAQMYGYSTPSAPREYGPASAQTPEQRRQERWRKQMAVLRKEAVKLRKQDGGQLSPVHRADIESRMAQINAEGGVKPDPAAAAANPPPKP